MSFQSPNVWTVGRLVRYLQALMHSDEVLQDLWVQGEVSNLSRPASGHLFFTLKDRWGQIRCVMWREHVVLLEALPQDGMMVEVHGRLDVYAARGAVQLYIDDLRVVGRGDLFREFLERKARLEAEGLFARPKRPLPAFPRTIAVVTSATGAALRDILRTLQRRYPLAEVWVAPSLVQGEDAPAHLVYALQRAAQAGPDLIILARGGGSLEDLMAFNDEDVVRAVAASPVPVVTGVGHETDFTLVDFAADHRAATPTAAAASATPDRADLTQRLRTLRLRLLRAYVRGLERHTVRLERLGWRLRERSPVYTLARLRERLEEDRERLTQAMARYLQDRRGRLDLLRHRLRGADPLGPLHRGYAWVTDLEGRTVARTGQARKGQPLRVHFADGALLVRVEGASRKEHAHNLG